MRTVQEFCEQNEMCQFLKHDGSYREYDICKRDCARSILTKSFRPRIFGMVDFPISGLVCSCTSLVGSIPFTVLVVEDVQYTFGVLLSSIAFGCYSKLLTTIFVLERVGININFLLLVSLSFPTPLQHPHAVVLAPGSSTLCALLVIGSHHSCHR